MLFEAADVLLHQFLLKSLIAIVILKNCSFKHLRLSLQKPDMYWKEEGKWCKFLKQNMSYIGAEYWSFYFVPGGKFQTVVAALLPKKHEVDYER